MPSKIGPSLPPSHNRPHEPEVSRSLKTLSGKVTAVINKKPSLPTTKNKLDGRVDVAPTSPLSKKFKKVVEESHR